MKLLWLGMICMSKNDNIDYKNIQVAVIYGGPSSEAEISKKSAKAVMDALQKTGFSVHEVEWSFNIECQLQDLKPDIAFIAMHGLWGEDGQIQNLLERLNIAYIGSDAQTCQNTYNKIRTKEILKKHHLPTLDYQVCQANSKIKILLDFPLICKPIAEGSSVGIHLIENHDELERVFRLLSKDYEEWFIEPFIAGREFTVAVWQGQALPVVEIVPEGRFFDFYSKYKSDKTVYHAPASMSPGLEKSLKEIGEQVYHIFQCRDLARVDFITKEDRVYVLEVNTIPGFTERSLFPLAARCAGISFQLLCEQLVMLASVRRTTIHAH